MMNEILSESQLKKMGVKRLPDEEVGGDSDSDTEEPSEVEPDIEEVEVVAEVDEGPGDGAEEGTEPAEPRAREWLKQNQNQPLNQSRSQMIAYLSSKP